MDNARSALGLSKPSQRLGPDRLAGNHGSEQQRLLSSFYRSTDTVQSTLAPFNRAKEYYFKRIRPMEEAQVRYD